MSNEDLSDNEEYLTAEEGSINGSIESFHHLKCHQTKGSRQRNQPLSATSLSLVIKIVEQCIKKVCEKSVRSEETSVNRENPAKTKIFKEDRFFSKMSTAKDKVRSDPRAINPPSKCTEKISPTCRPALKPNTLGNGVKEKQTSVKPEKTRAPTISTDTGLNNKPKPMYSEVAATRSSVGYTKKGASSWASSCAVHATRVKVRNTSASSQLPATSSTQTMVGANNEEKERTIQGAVDGAEKKVLQTEAPSGDTRNHLKTGKETKGPSHLGHQVEGVEQASSGKQPKANGSSTAATLVMKQEELITAKKKSVGLGSDEDKEKRHIPTSQPRHSTEKAPNIGRQPTKYAQCASSPVTSILVKAESKSHIPSCHPRHPPGKTSNADHKSTKYARLPGTSVPPGKVPKRTVSKSGKDVEQKSLPTEENCSPKAAECSQAEDGSVSSSTGFFSSIRNKVFGFFMPSKKENKVEEEMLIEEALPVKVSLEDDLCDASSSSTKLKISGSTPTDGGAKLSPATQTCLLPSKDKSTEGKVTISTGKDPGSSATSEKLEVRGTANLDSVLIMKSLKKDGLRPPKQSLSAVRTQETVPQDCQQSSVVSNQGLRGKDMVPGLDASQKGTIVAEKKAHIRTRSRSQPVTAATSTLLSKGAKGKVPLNKPQLVTERSRNDPSTNKATRDSSSSKIPAEKEKESCSLKVDDAASTGEATAHPDEGKDDSLDSRATEQSLVTSTLLSLAAAQCGKGQGSETTKQPTSVAGPAAKKANPSTGTVRGFGRPSNGMSTTCSKLANVGKPGKKDISCGVNRPVTAGMAAAVSCHEAAAPALSTVPAKSETRVRFPKSESCAPDSTDSSAVRSLSTNSETLNKTSVDETKNAPSLPPRSSHSSSASGLPIRVENSAAKVSAVVGNITGHHGLAPVTEKTLAQGGSDGVNSQTSFCSNATDQPHNPLPGVVDRVMAGVSSKAPDPRNPTLSLGSGVSPVVSTVVSTDASHNTRPIGVHPTYASVTSQPLKHTGDVAYKPKDNVKPETSQPCAMETFHSIAGTFAPKLTFIDSPAPLVCKPGLDVGTSRAKSGKVKGPNSAEGGASSVQPPEIVFPATFPAWSMDGTRAPRFPPTETSLNLTTQLPLPKEPFRQSEGITDDQVLFAQQPTSATLNHQQQKCIKGRNQESFHASGGIPFNTTAGQTSYPHVFSTGGIPPPVFKHLTASYQANAPGMDIGCKEPPTLPTTGPPEPRVGHVHQSAFNGPGSSGGIAVSLSHRSSLTNAPVEQVAKTVGSEAPGVAEPKEKPWLHIVDVNSEVALRDTKHEEAEEEEEDEESSDGLEEVRAFCSDVRNRRKLRAKRRLQQQQLAGAKPEEKEFQERAVQNQEGEKKEKQRMKTTAEKPLKGVDEKVVEAGKECKVKSQPSMVVKGAKSFARVPAAAAACKPPVVEPGSGKKQKPITVVHTVPGPKLDTSEPARQDSGSKVATQKSERKKRNAHVPRPSSIQDQGQATDSTEVKRDRENGNFDDDEAIGKTLRKGNRNKSKRKVKGQGSRVNVNFRKSINCCCETVCDLCVP